MKKMLITILAVMFVGVVNVNAMSKEDLMAELEKEYTVGGESVKLDATIVKSIEEYLTTNEINEDEMDTIYEQFSEVKTYLAENEGAYDAKTGKLNEDAMKVVSNSLATISENTNVNVSISNDGKVVAKNKDGKVFATYEANGLEIRKTNGNYVLVAVASVITLAGAAVLTKKIVETRA